MKLKPAALLPLIIVIVSGSCNFLLEDKEEVQLSHKIDEKVWLANVKPVAVTLEGVVEKAGEVSANNLTGTISPTLPFSVKPSIEFTVHFEPAGDYEFLRWEAVNTVTGKLLRGDEVTIPPAGEDRLTSIKFWKELPPVILRAVCGERPKVSLASPKGDTPMEILRPIQVRFSQPLDSHSFDNFKNIGIRKISIHGTEGTDEDLVPYFQNPVYENSILTLRPKSGGVPMYSMIEVTIGKDIVNVEHGIGMAADEVWTYRVGSATDREPPAVEAVMAARTTRSEIVYFNNSDFTVDRRFGGSSTQRELYIALAAWDEVSNEVSSIKLSERRAFDIEGNPLGGAADWSNGVTVNRVDFLKEKSSAAFEFIKQTNTKYSDYQIIKYVLKNRTSDDDGIIELNIQVADPSDNITPEQDAIKLYVVYDAHGPEGFPIEYNNFVLSAEVFGPKSMPLFTGDFPDGPITLTDTGMDYASEKNLPAVRGSSKDFLWSFKVGEYGKESPFMPLGIYPAVDLSGDQYIDEEEYSVYVTLADEFGNTSSPIALASPRIPMDRTAPEITALTITIPQAGVESGEDWQVNKGVVNAAGGLKFDLELNFPGSNDTLASSEYLFSTNPLGSENPIALWRSIPQTGKPFFIIPALPPNGILLIYGWVRDAVGNVSDPETIKIDIGT